MIVCQVLRDAAGREAYDQQLAMDKVLGEVFVADTISLDDLQDIEDTNQLGYDCRCGGMFLVDKEEVFRSQANLLLCCTHCSSMTELQVVCDTLPTSYQPN